MIDQSLAISDAFAADLDQDGDVDLAVLAGGGIQTGWLENVDGGSAFRWHGIAEDSDASVWDTKIKAFDVDGDGDLDILASFADGTIRLWRNDDAASDLWTAEVVAPDFANVFDFTVGDLDDDGRPEVAGVAARASDSAVRYYSPPATPGQSWTETVIDVGQSASFSSIDGYDSPVRDAPDLILMGNGVTRLTRNPDGIWETTKLSMRCDDFNEEELDLTDMDNDGDLDILCADVSDIFVYENVDGDFGEVVQHLVADLWDHRNRTGADIDGDGYPEVLIANVGNCMLENPTYYSDEAWPRSCLPPVEGSYIQRLDTADFDGDGDLDVYGTDSIATMDAFPWFENPRL